MNTALFRQLDTPNLLTLTGLILSFLAAVFAISGQFYASILCILYIGLIDVFDGFLARQWSRSNGQAALGEPLDSLVDLCGFGFAPVIFGYCYGLRDWPSITILALYLFACAARLAYFDSAGLQQNGETAYFVGLPATFAALFFPNLFVLNFFLDRHAMISVLILIYLGMTLAMVGGFRIAKSNAKREGCPKRYILLPIGAVLLSIIYIGAIISSIPLS